METIEKTEKSVSEDIVNNSVKEIIVIDELLNSSNEFKHFYETERLKISKNIYWLDKNSLKIEALSKNHLALTLKLQDGNWAIILRKIPVPTEDETIIAHELAHIVLIEEGFPPVWPYMGCKDHEIYQLAECLTNMIHDPLVIMKLNSHGFSLRDEYAKEYQQDLEQIKNVNMSPSGIQRIKSTLAYVQTNIEIKIIFPEGNSVWNEYIWEFRKKFSPISDKGDRMISIINKHGYQNPDSVRKIYEEIIELYQMSDIIHIK